MIDSHKSLSHSQSLRSDRVLADWLYILKVGDSDVEELVLY